MDAVRNSFGEFYPVHLLYIFPYIHYPFYRSDLLDWIMICINRSLSRISLCISIYLMIGVGIERFIAVCRPHHFRQVQTDNYRYEDLFLWYFKIFISDHWYTFFLVYCWDSSSTVQGIGYQSSLHTFISNLIWCWEDLFLDSWRQKLQRSALTFLSVDLVMTHRCWRKC